MEIRQLPASKLAEYRVGVFLREKLVFALGFDRYSLMSDVVYITMEPTEALLTLTFSEFKELREMFNEIRGWRLCCQVAINDAKANHWARFFGFEAKERVQGRWHYEKDTR